MRDRAVVATLVLALAVAAAAVAVPGSPNADGIVPSDASGGTFAAPALVGYREGVVGGWTSLTPISAATAADRQLVALVFSGLVRLGPGQTLEPDLASGWQAEDEGRRFVVELRPDGTWHDGTPVTADDVVFTFRTLKDPTYVGPLGASWAEVNVRKLDDRRVEFTLASALAGFPQALTQPILPAHLLEGLSPAEIAESAFASAPIGSGRFRLSSIDAERAELVRVAEPEPALEPVPVEPAAAPVASTTGEGSGGTASAVGATTPEPTPTPTLVEGVPIDLFELRFYRDAAAASAALAAGEVDAVAGLDPASVRTATSGGARALRYPGATLTAVVPNERGTSTFKNLAVRQALSTAIDRDALVTAVMGAEAVRADGLVPPASWAFDASVTPEIAFDRSAATAALKKAGWTRGGGSWIAKGFKKPLVLELIAPNEATSPATWAAAERVASAWRAIGFGVNLVGLERDELAKRLQGGSFMLSVVSINLTLDPDLFPFLASSQVRTDGSNIAGVQSKALDGLLAKARRPGSDFDRRTAYKRLQAYLAENEPILPLYFASSTVVASPALQGVTIRQVASAGDRYWDVLTWRLADGR